VSSKSVQLAALVDLPGDQLTSLIARLAAASMTVASAESLTGGLLSALLTEVPGSSAVVRGGLVVYATDLKHSLAGVDQGLLDERGPVDPDVAVALARGVRTACGASIGLGLTGVAGPDPQHGVEVGTWYVALAGVSASGIPIERLVTHRSDRQEADHATRAGIRSAAVRAAVGLLVDLVGS
jgi:nicotinamide-nucleotide amidase